MRYFWIAALAALLGCRSSGEQTAVYQGRVDADVIRVSAKSAGTIDTLAVREGMTVRRGALMARLDEERIRTQLALQQAQQEEAEANMKALLAQRVQLTEEKQFTASTLEKTRRMVSRGAATAQKADELQTRLEGLKAQIKALDARVAALKSKEKQLRAAMALTGINLKDTRISAPVNGVVLTRLHSAGEMVGPGAPLFEMADLSRVDVLCYVPLSDLPAMKPGRVAKISVDGLDQPLEGKVVYIADRSEFTPKTILTRETRTTLVYRIKINVDNARGYLKIGMPVDVSFGE